MAGPTATVLFETIPTELIWDEIENILHIISDKVEENDFWVLSTTSINGTIENEYGRPFGIEKRVIDSNLRPEPARRKCNTKRLRWIQSKI